MIRIIDLSTEASTGLFVDAITALNFGPPVAAADIPTVDRSEVAASFITTSPTSVALPTPELTGAPVSLPEERFAFMFGETLLGKPGAAEIEANEGDSIFIMSTTNSIKLYRSDGSFVCGISNHSLFLRTTTVTCTLDANDTYVMPIPAFRVGQPPVFTIESVNRPSHGTRISWGETIRAEYLENESTDVYHFEAVAGDRAFLRYGSILDNIRLFDPTGVIVCLGETELLCDIATTGTYTVLVLRDIGRIKDPRKYSLYLQRWNSPVGFKTINGYRTSDTPDGAEINGFFFDAQAGDFANVQVIDTFPRLTARIFDPFGELVCRLESQGRCFLNYSGTYTILISAGRPPREASYELRLRLEQE